MFSPVGCTNIDATGGAVYGVQQEIRARPTLERHPNWRDWNLDPTSNVATGTSLQDLTERIGSEHVVQRLKIEVEHEAQLFGKGLIFFDIKNWYLAPWIVRTALKLTGLYGRAR